MWLSELSVAGFRNLLSQAVEFEPRANLVFGPNGAGKTNLLEAIAVLATGRSFRTIQDAQMLCFEASSFRVAGRAFSPSPSVHVHEGKEGKEREWSGRVYFSPAERKHYFLDRREVPKRALFAGWLPVSIFLLDDRRLVAGSPGQRRSFLDEAIGKVSRTYRFLLSEFRRLVAHRNALLRRNGSGEEFVVWETRLAEVAVEISERRVRYWSGFKEHFRKMGQRFLPHDKLDLEYLADVEEIQVYPEVLARMRESDRRFGYTRRGPHRDDFRILLNSRPLRSFGSYGQQRLAALALSLAEAQAALEAGRRPVYLMDDVAAELDDANTKLLFDLVSAKGQLFYAAARPPAVEGKRFHVKEGKIRKV